MWKVAIATSKADPKSPRLTAEYNIEGNVILDSVTVTFMSYISFR